MGATKQSWIIRKANGKGIAWNKGKKLHYSVWNKGKKLVKAHKKKISINTKLGMMNPQIKSKIREIAKNRKFSLKTRIKMSNKHKGIKHWNWKGGISSLNERIRKSFEYKLWRKAVFERDQYTCRFCGIQSIKDNFVLMQADHIKPFAYYPELRFAIDNGRTLCVPCHKTTDTYGEKAKKFKTIKGSA